MGHISSDFKVGTYTGDGSTSLAITGLGFKPKVVWIWPYSNAAGSKNFKIIKTSSDSGNLAYEEYSGDWKDNAVNSLDEDGFSVDDAGTDIDPNTAGVVYIYIAFG